jgi:hypothetical protein
VIESARRKNCKYRGVARHYAACEQALSIELDPLTGGKDFSARLSRVVKASLGWLAVDGRKTSSGLKAH